MKWLCGLILILLPALLFAGITEDFQKAISLYDQGNFPESAQIFQSLIDKGYSSPQLFYNAGCAYFKAGKKGMAIANFRRAERLSPDDDDIRTNLQFAKLFTVDKIETQPEAIFPTKVGNALAVLHPNYYFLISLLALTLLFAILSARRSGIFARLGNAPVVILSIVTALCLVAMIWVTNANYLSEEGVIVTEQTEILSGPGSDFELQFEGHEGLTFQILDKKNDYFLGLFANKLKGWVKTTAVEQI